jgi:hypothetical protein
VFYGDWLQNVNEAKIHISLYEYHGISNSGLRTLGKWLRVGVIVEGCHDVMVEYKEDDQTQLSTVNMTGEYYNME